MVGRPGPCNTRRPRRVHRSNWKEAADSYFTTRNPLGQVTQVTIPTVSYTHTYDPAHRFQTVTDNRGDKTLTYTWTAGGRLATLRDGEGSRTDYFHDPASRLTER